MRGHRRRRPQLAGHARATRRDGETFNALLKRFDRAIARYFDTGETPDKINPPSE
jgi:hypothetical protein